MSTEEWAWGTQESVAAAAHCFGSREELIEALEAKGWAVYVSCIGESVMGIPKGSPTPDECPFCSLVRQEDTGPSLPGMCAIFAYSPTWEDETEEHGFVLQYQGLPLELDGITVAIGEIPTPQQAEAIMRKAAKRDS